MNKRVIYILTLCIISISSCINGPLYDYDCVKINRNGHNCSDTITFSIETHDTTALHDIYFITRCDKDFISPTINGDIVIISPSGEITKTTISIPADKRWSDGVIRRSSQNGIYDIEWLWKRGVKPLQMGVWNIELIITNRDPSTPNIIKGIHEIGINCRKQDERKR